MNSVTCSVLLLFTFLTLSVCQDDFLSRTFQFGGSKRGDSCEADGQMGVCQRRTRCRRPTNKICSIGIIPVICCLNEPERTKPTTTTTTKRPRTSTTTTDKPIVFPKPQASGTHVAENLESADEIDILFPGCGTRYPPEPKQMNGRNSGSNNNNNGGVFGFLGRGIGKRSVSFEPYLATDRGLPREKRGLLDRLGQIGKQEPVIVGGVTAKPHSWPWMVAIFTKSSSNPKFLCGASLISKRYVLSAAHCFPAGGRLNPSKYTVLMGAHDTQNTSAATWYDVESVLLHPQYRSGQYYNDISILKLTEEVKLGSKVHPVCLPSASLRSRIAGVKRNVTVTGWGDTSFGGRASKVLQEVELPVVPLKKCNESYYSIARGNFPNGITNVFLCAGVKEGGKDACQGDSGGPLVMQMNDANYVQLGVVSFGYECASPGFPGVYTRISKFAKWIHDNTDLGK